ncbi:MAG TPA: HIT domain-containing protein [Candidatus Baltobacteraceae bacterium]|nr:HIT domain-containing protein [Candidatus Baltobacteraceae bacterium]
MNCIFCKIAAGEIPATFAHRDDDVIAITDVNPQAPQHLLVLPVRHAANLPELAGAGENDLIAKLFATAAQLGREVSSDGFRLVVNTGELGGQTVDHVHIHVLGGRPMQWPPG